MLLLLMQARTVKQLKLFVSMEKISGPNDSSHKKAERQALIFISEQKEK